MSQSMNETATMKLKYETIKKIIHTTQISVSTYPKVSNNLSLTRISKLIKDSPFYSTAQLQSDFNMENNIAHGIEVMMKFLKHGTVTTQSSSNRSDMSSLTVKME